MNRNDINTNKCLFQTIFETSVEAILVVGKDNSIKTANSACEQLFGYEPGELHGKNLEILFPDKITNQIRTHAKSKKEKSQGNRKGSDLWGIMKDGTRFSLDVTFKPAQIKEESLTIVFVRDVTSQKNEVLLKIRDNALASADNGILISDAQQPGIPIIYCNAAFEKITGYKKEEVYGRNCNFLQGDDRNQKEIDIMKKSVRNGESCKVVLRNYKKDGTLFWNEVAITPIRTKQNKLTHFIGVQNDVSSRVKAEHLKNKIRKILEFVTQDKSIKTIGNTIVETVGEHVSNTSVSILLLDKKNKRLKQLAATNSPKVFSQFIKNSIVNPKTEAFGHTAFFKKEIIIDDIENDATWKDHKAMPLINNLKSFWSFPIISSKKKVLGLLVVFNSKIRRPSDIEKEIIYDMIYLASVSIEKHYNTNELKAGKKQLETYAEQLESKVKERTQEVMATVQKLVQTNLDLEDQVQIAEEAKKNALTSKAITHAIAKNYPKGFIAVMNKDLQLVLAEGEALEQLDLKSILFEGMTVDDLSVFAEERKKRIKDDISKTLAGEHLSFETEYKNRYFSVNTAPLFDEDNEINHALLVYNDISKQKEIELNIKKALDKEKELNELKSRFVSMASHEFRTPLSAILTSSILIGKQNGIGNEHKREKYILQIEKNVNHLIAILNDFLSLGKLEEGKVKAKNEYFDIIQFFKTLIKESRIGLKKHQHINLILSPETLHVNLDRKLLHHVLTNLISNAIKYSGENNDIDIKIVEQQDKVIITIKDDGIGIPYEEQEKLFNRFYRANNAVNFEGTGLGLNIAKHYTELMGGAIGFVSKLNSGSTFWLEFPIDGKE